MTSTDIGFVTAVDPRFGAFYTVGRTVCLAAFLLDGSGAGVHLLIVVIQDREATLQNGLVVTARDNTVLGRTGIALVVCSLALNSR